MRFDDENSGLRAADTEDTAGTDKVADAPNGDEVIKSLIKRMRQHDEVGAKPAERKESGPGYATHLDPPREPRISSETRLSPEKPHETAKTHETARQSDTKVEPRFAEPPAHKSETGEVAQRVTEPLPAEQKSATPPRDSAATRDGALASFLETNEAIRSLRDCSKSVSKPAETESTPAQDPGPIFETAAEFHVDAPEPSTAPGAPSATETEAAPETQATHQTSVTLEAPAPAKASVTLETPSASEPSASAELSATHERPAAPEVHIQPEMTAPVTGTSARVDTAPQVSIGHISSVSETTGRELPRRDMAAKDNGQILEVRAETLERPTGKTGEVPEIKNPGLKIKSPDTAPEVKVEPSPGLKPFREPTSPNIPDVLPDTPKKQRSTPDRKADSGGGQGTGNGGTGGGGGGRRPGSNPSSNPNLGKRHFDQNFREVLTKGLSRCRRSLVTVGIFSFFVNLLVLSIPLYLFQISDRVLTSRSTDTLIMLSMLVIGFLAIHVLLDMSRRLILMRIAVDLETRLGPSVLSAAAKASQNGSNREYQTLGDLQHLRSFVTGPVLLTMFDIPIIPIYLLAVYLIHPQLGYIVTCTGGALFVIALINQRMTAVPFGQANAYGVRANLQADAMSRNAQVINAMGMIPEGVQIWGRETMDSLKSQVVAQDRNVLLSTISKFVRLCTQIGLLGWGAWLALNNELTGGMLIAASIVGSRALAPIEGAIEGWRGFVQARSSYARIRTLLLNSPLNLERLRLPNAKGRVTVERVLYVPPPTKKVILNGISFELNPGESLAIVGASGSGKSTLGRMLVGSIVPTAGNVRLDHMDLRNWDPRQFGESVGYLPQDVQLFPATIKANIARMREDATDDQIYEAAETADVHEMISQFAAGYETQIGVDGAPLSGGQKQRIGLARAFFGDPRMVVLDEPNSNLDVPGEKALARALMRAKAKEITVIAITQRPSLLKHVDKIMLLKDGTMQAMGPRQDMLQMLKSGGALEGGSSPKLTQQ